jgi:hypothetical protein
MIEESKQKHPEISHEIYRWSRSHFYSYMAEVNYRAGDYKGAIHWMYKALCSDEVAILSPWRAKLIIATLSKVLAKLVTPLIWSDRHALLYFKKRSYSENRVNTTLPELVEDNEDKVFPWKPLEPFRPDRRHSNRRS